MTSLQLVNVLLIEDNPSDVLLLRSALEADPLSTFTLTQVERLSDGLKQLDGEIFDIILADLGLPDSSGLGTFERLREQAPNLPIIVFSGNENEEQAVHAVSEGAQDYLIKSLSGFDMAARSIRYAIERNKLQSSVKDSEHWFNAMFRSNPVPVGITRQSDYCIVDVNDAWINLTGYSREEAIGHTSTELGLTRPETLQQIRGKLGKQGTVHQVEIPLYTRNGEERQMLISSEPLVLGEDGYFLNNLLDITERKRSEEALKESEARFSTAFFTNPVSQSILSIETGKAIEVNDACCRLYEFSREELIGANPGKLHLWANPADELSAINELQKTGHVLPKEVTIQAKSGEKRTILFTVEPIPWKGAPCLITSSVDISERKQAEHESTYRQELLEKVIQLGKNIATLTDLEHCLREIYNSARFGLGFDRVGLFLYDATLRHVRGVYGTTRTGEVQEPGFYDEPVEQFSHTWENALQSPSNVVWIEDYQDQVNPPRDNVWGWATCNRDCLGRGKTSSADLSR